MQFTEEQAASRIVLNDGTVLTKCDQCRQLYAERIPPEEPPCETCHVELMPENEDAARIFFLVRSQMIMSMSGPVDVNHLAVYAAMDLYKIPNKRDCFEKVTKTCRWWINSIKKKDE